MGVLKQYRADMLLYRSDQPHKLSAAELDARYHGWRDYLRRTNNTSTAASQALPIRYSTPLV